MWIFIYWLHKFMLKRKILTFYTNLWLHWYFKNNNKIRRGTLFTKVYKYQEYGSDWYDYNMPKERNFLIRWLHTLCYWLMSCDINAWKTRFYYEMGICHCNDRIPYGIRMRTTTWELSNSCNYHISSISAPWCLSYFKPQ